MIGIETAATARIAVAREIAESRRAQFARYRAHQKPRTSAPAARRSGRARIRSASRA
jgi:hypothetical protein